MPKYTAITFAPVQGFIEKSRKLRDLYGSSQILSYLSQELLNEAGKTTEVVSPAIIKMQKGMPNRILLKGDFTEKQARDTLSSAWKRILFECRSWIGTKLPEKSYGTYHWEREWQNWGNYAWEVFCGSGDTISAAMEDLETKKLSRDWIGVNWIGESSSLTGTDAIAFPGLGAESRNPNNRKWSAEKEEIKTFYRRLACVLEGISLDKEPEGKYIALEEKLSIPELVKRLVTHEDIATSLGISPLGNSFSDIYRRPEKITETEKGRCTGWFMGDGDKVGDYLKDLAQKSDAEVKLFSQAMREWGRDFARDFPKEFGRVVYAGGDDFLGAIYSDKDKPKIEPEQVYQWLLELPNKWREHKQPINVSVGFIWAASSVPQRDILQHCREAEKVAKSLGRNRVTIRILFNSGQYVEWTCPWNYLNILDKYKDLDGNSNWSHIYTDLAQLEARNAFNIDKRTFNRKFALDFFDIYFPGEGEKLSKDNNLLKNIVGYTDDDEEYERVEKTIDWMRSLIKVGFQLCSNT
ncbi:Cas10/Cmr2 second palm domain-containing protein [Calothrix sp. PCC 6303]|uniref:Cas10/Cmr2 second palm domain-containing protein n=1 Tax=Calothrix sp. PCC 6303 TaxID=1170562 RepID=UPI0002A01613|nr:type III-B CRISPR-associated protein Cas10/Cmr2 [Calothrix sp. PCC 6303]AFY99372.1 hypothetical protein Cal6303_0277 [Calothrix sp. PCC 6303]